MNGVYFVCRKPREYTDAGYRWAYWTLEDKGVVTPGAPVGVAAVFDQEEYWNPAEAERNAWLCQDILPTVRRFFIEHQSDGIEYVDDEFLLNSGSWVTNGVKSKACANVRQRKIGEQLAYPLRSDSF